jgi:hypothetical protein
MNRRVFENHLSDLKAHILASAAHFFTERNMNFDSKRMELDAAGAVDGLARDFFFIGSETFPQDEH